MLSNFYKSVLLILLIVYVSANFRYSGESSVNFNQLPTTYLNPPYSLNSQYGEGYYVNPTSPMHGMEYKQH